MDHDFLPGVIAPTLTSGPNTGGMEEGVIAKSESCKQGTTIDTFPEDVVLHIFEFCRFSHNPNAGHPPRAVWKWHRLTHVCQRWRQIVFANPRRLDLQIYCMYGTPLREIVRFWPTLPIAIDFWISNDGNGSATPNIPPQGWYHTLTELEHPDRVCSIRVVVQDLLSEEMAEVEQRPFPILATFTLRLIHGHQALPDTFLGGYAPRLQEVRLDAIPFPTFPRFILSASDLVKLDLLNLPPNGSTDSISARTMVTSLATLTKLETLRISFEPSFERWTYIPAQRLDGPVTRTVLPALTQFLLIGAREYLEEFVGQIETPQLTNLKISFFSPKRVVQLPELAQFIGRVENLKLAKFRHAHIDFQYEFADISFNCSEAERHHCSLDLTISCHFPWAGPSMTQLMTQLLTPSSFIISNVRDLCITTRARSWTRGRNEDLTTEWLAFLRPFTAVETLSMCDPVSGIVVTALEDSTDDLVTEVLPALQLLNLAGQPLTSGAIEKFVAARQLSGRPVTVDTSRII